MKQRHPNSWDPHPPPRIFWFFFYSIVRSFVSKEIRWDWGRILPFIPTHIWTSFRFFLFSFLLFALPACKRSGGERKKTPPPHPIPPKGRSHTPFKAAQRHTVHPTPPKKKKKKRRLKQKMYTRLSHVKETEREEKQETGVAVRCCTYQGGYCENLHWDWGNGHGPEMIVRDKVCHQTGIALQKQKPDKEVRERNEENQRNGKHSVSLSDTQTDLPCCSNFQVVNKLPKLTKNANCG